MVIKILCLFLLLTFYEKLVCIKEHNIKRNG